METEVAAITASAMRGEIDFEEYGTIVAKCRVDQGPVLNVPYTMLAPPFCTPSITRGAAPALVSGTPRSTAQSYRVLPLRSGFQLTLANWGR